MWVADPKHVRRTNFGEYVSTHLDEYQRAAKARMDEYDRLPKEVREVVNQHGCLNEARKIRIKERLLQYVQYSRSLSALWLTKDGTAIKRQVPNPDSRSAPPPVAKSIPKTGRARSTKSAMELFK